MGYINHHNKLSIMVKPAKIILSLLRFVLTSMRSKTYSLAPAKIGNSSGFRLPVSFYRDHPRFANATGWVEVLADDTLLIKLEPVEVERESDEENNELMLSLFLDFITKDALKNSDRLEAYTEAMAQDDDELLEGVEIDL
jgi:antitoxin PrlF